MNYKKIIVFILAITLLSSISFADSVNIVDSSSGTDFQLYLGDDEKLYGIGSNAQGELGLGEDVSESEELEEITTDVMLPQIGDSSIKRTVAAGADFAAILKKDNKVYATGDNYFGQLGVGDYSSRYDFITPMSGTNNADIVSISAGADFILVLNSSGKVFGAGDNAWGQIKANGEATYSTLTLVYEDTKKAIAIATGSRHSIILLEDGSVITLGDNEYHQRDITIPKGRKALEIAAGSYHSLVRLDDNSVWGVGSNADQQLIAHIGGGNVLDQYRSTMVQLVDSKGKGIKVHKPEDRVRSISAGYDFSMVITKGDDDKVTVVGIGNKYGDQFGVEAKTKEGNVIEIETIDEVKNITASWLHSIIMGQDKGNNKTESKGDKFYGDVGVGKPIKDQNAKSIAMGAGHTLYVRDNVLYGAGANAYGQLGISTYSSYVRKIPFNVDAIGGIKQIATGATHSVILGVDGSIWVTGYNYSGQLGLGDNKDRTTFTKLDFTFDSPVIAVAAGGDVTMILTQKGTVYAMGDNAYGQINSDPAALKNYNTPTIYSEDENITSIAAGVRHTIVLKADRNVIARGENISDIMMYSSGGYVEKIAAGPYHSLLLLDDGAVESIGRNTNGQLGLGSTSSYSFGGVQFEEIVKVKDIVAGYAHSLFLTDKGIFIAGNISGNTDLEENKIIATKITNVTNPQEIATGWLGNIVKTATSILTIGSNEYGQRGTLKGEESAGYDDEVAGVSKKKIAAGDGFTLILNTDGTLWGMGANTSGQLGTGDNVDKEIFVKIAKPYDEKGKEVDIADIKASGNKSHILTKSGEIYGAGSNINYGYGAGSTQINVNSFTKLDDIANVKDFWLVSSVMIVLKNDGTLWVKGCCDVPPPGIIWSEWTKIDLELAEGEFVKNVIDYARNGMIYVVISDNKRDTDNRAVSIAANGVNSSSILVEYSEYGDFETLSGEIAYGTNAYCNSFVLSDGKLYVENCLTDEMMVSQDMKCGPAKEHFEADYEDKEAHMITVEGTNNLDYSVEGNVGTNFTERIDSVAFGSKHVVVLTESGQIYSAGSNKFGSKLGLLGNETLNNKNIEMTNVFVPTYIQNISAPSGVVVK